MISAVSSIKSALFMSSIMRLHSGERDVAAFPATARPAPTC
jgi:hypothetical protein